MSLDCLLCMHAGIDGIKIKIFSTSMDTKGREELLGMQSCQSYQGCPVCLHAWTKGKTIGRKQVVCDGYRCFLHKDSAARNKSFVFEGQKYEYRSPASTVAKLCLLIIIGCLCLQHR